MEKEQLELFVLFCFNIHGEQQAGKILRSVLVSVHWCLTQSHAYGHVHIDDSWTGPIKK